MKQLEKWQIVSLLSRGFATFVGLVQSFLIIRILTVGEWGLIQLAGSIGAALGIYQHLGLAAASTREISEVKEDQEIYKIVVTSVSIRYLVTVPLALVLFIFAQRLGAGLYKNQQLVLPLQIYAVTLFFQGFQSIFNAVISGTQRFKRLFLYQAFVAVLNLLIFLPFVYSLRVNGYYWAYLCFNILNTLFLFHLAFAPLKAAFVLPSKEEFMAMFKKIFSFSMAIYLVKILATNWEKLGSNLLGLYQNPEIIGFLAFALLYSKKILSISDAVTDVSLPVLSEKYTKDIDDFRASFTKNFDKVFLAIVLSSLVAGFWAPQIIQLLVGNKYVSAYPLIPITLFGFVTYSFLDILKSSVFVPAKLVKEMISSFFILVFVTLAVFFGLYKTLSPLFSVSISLAAGAGVGFAYSCFVVKKKLVLEFFRVTHTAVLMQVFVVIGFGVYFAFPPKILLFVLLTIPLIVTLFLFKFINKSTVSRLLLRYVVKRG